MPNDASGTKHRMTPAQGPALSRWRHSAWLQTSFYLKASANRRLNHQAD
jgi:hypothetical protein